MFVVGKYTEMALYASKRFCWFCYTWLRVVLFEVSVAYIRRTYV